MSWACQWEFSLDTWWVIRLANLLERRKESTLDPKSDQLLGPLLGLRRDRVLDQSKDQRLDPIVDRLLDPE